MIGIKTSGSFDRTLNALNRLTNGQVYAELDRYGKMGVEALSQNTPVDTGKTAASWSFITSVRKGKYTIEWHNSNVVDGVPIAIIIQYGHATRNGGFISGLDYINPALRPVFENIVSDIWRKVIL
jgi:hypothetical protein